MHQLVFHNTKTRHKTAFAPIDPTNVRMYVCGPTVYDRAHIGNARPLIVFDVVFRLLRHKFGENHVTYVRNITDVDDKINERASVRGIAIDELTAETIELFHQDGDALGLLRPSVEPRATHYIEEMRVMIERLVELGTAYVAEEHVLFDVDAHEAYGSLSGRSLDEMIAGARVEVAPYKRTPMDFVLWKPSGEGQPAWDSPAGIETPGRPGWHIECSAMSHKHLGETFDIHGGGIDLAFPHHENERAQSCAALGVDEIAHTWMHNGFLQVEGRKMSKSEGNFITIGDALARAPGDVLRLAMLSTHYRQPLDWTEARIQESEKRMEDWAAADPGSDPVPDDGVLDALADDLNTPAALTRLGELYRNGAASFGASAALMGFDLARAGRGIAARRGERAAELTIDVDALVAERLAARAARDFARADAIRDELTAQGVVLKDGKDAEGQAVTTWEMA